MTYIYIYNKCTRRFFKDIASVYKYNICEVRLFDIEIKKNEYHLLLKDLSLKGIMQLKQYELLKSLI